MRDIIIYFSPLLLIAVVRMTLQPYTYTTYMYLFNLLEVVGKCAHISDYIFTSFFVLWSTVLQNTTFVLILSYKSVSVGFYLVDCSPFLLMCMCTIVVFLDFSRFFLMNFSVRPGHILRKPCLIALKRLAVVGLNSAACKYGASSGLDVCSSMLFNIVSDCCVPRNSLHIPVFLFLVPLIISVKLLWTGISCLSIVMVHP